MGKYTFNSLSSTEFTAFATDVLMAHHFQRTQCLNSDQVGKNDRVFEEQKGDGQVSIRRWLVSCKNFSAEEISHPKIQS